MRISDRQFVLFKRLQVLSGVVPVGLFLFFHFFTNGRAIAGRAAFDAAVADLARLPWLGGIELVAIGVPIVLHLALGTVLGLTEQGAFERAHPDERRRTIQRATGLYLAMFVVIHVWALRLAPDRTGTEALYDLVAKNLHSPVLFALNWLAVLAASVHFSLGCAGLFGPNAFELGPGGTRAARALGLAGFAILLVVGTNALLAFVWPAAQWLAPR